MTEHNTKIKTAVILAAGLGTRLDNVTGGEFPKPLTPIDGTPIIELSILALIKHGVNRILLGCGHMIENFDYLKDKYEEVEVVENKKYAEFGSIYTLLVFEELVPESFFLLEGDILYDSNGLKFLVKNAGKENGMLASAPASLDDNVFYNSTKSTLQKLSKEKPSREIEGVMTGIWILSQGFLQRFASFCSEEGISYNEDYEHLLANYSKQREAIKVIQDSDFDWCEIDTEKHLEYALNEVWPKIKDKV